MDIATAPKPAPPKSRAVPILIGLVIVLALAVAGLAVALLRAGGTETPTIAAAATPTKDPAFAVAKGACEVVAGYRVEDGGQTLTMTVGGAYMSAGTLACVFDQLGVPAAVRDHVSTTRALDGQQTDSWAGYTARWTYHPDDGLQITIRTA
jgi:hypothetical protein